MEKNEEVEEIKQKIIICVIVFIFVIVIGLVFVFNRFGMDTNDVIEALYDRENMVIFFTNNSGSCDTCSMVEDELNNQGVSYYQFDVRSNQFSSAREWLKINYELEVPAVYVIEEGAVLYNITNIQDQETIRSFILQNNVVNFSNQE